MLELEKLIFKIKLKLSALNEMGDLTFPYQSLDGNTETIKKIIEGKHEVSDLIKQAKRPMVIMGQSALKSKSSKYIFESIKEFLEE